MSQPSFFINRQPSEIVIKFQNFNWAMVNYEKLADIQGFFIKNPNKIIDFIDFHEIDYEIRGHLQGFTVKDKEKMIEIFGREGGGRLVVTYKAERFRSNFTLLAVIYDLPVEGGEYTLADSVINKSLSYKYKAAFSDALNIGRRSQSKYTSS